ncbi:MAG TPA: dynamin family protein [Gammaproteobacteria bacterium]
MAGTTKASLQERFRRLEAHLQEENPELLGIVQSFRRLDAVAYRLGLLDNDESYATQVSWWPLIAVLGTYSSGKSTFINTFLGRRLQATGNQAVDDKFTVICYGRDATSRVLPGLALDNDPRFPFYQISGEIDEMLGGDDQRLDSYLQLKTTDSEAVRGKIIIDSPGFDADDQRTATLRITSHIIDLSDLVLVFFDARHPEAGTMRDTLEYLVGATLRRPDFNKFLYILNQIDNAAREDNPEEVFAAWQRALAQKGLTAGRFYQIYDPEAAVPIENEHLRRRFEAKREQDTAAILERVRQIEVERSYRVAGKLEQTAELIRDRLVPRLEAARRTWRRRLLWLDGILLGAVVAALLFASFAFDWWDGARFAPPWLDFAATRPVLFWSGVVLILVAVWLVHRLLRRLAGRSVLRQLRNDASLGEHAARVANAFEKNLRSWRPYFFTRPRGWTAGTRKRLNAVLDEAHAAIQRLNDRYTDPSGRREAAAPAAAAGAEQVQEPAESEQRAANGGQPAPDAWPPPAPRRRAFFGRRFGGAAAQPVPEEDADDRAYRP